MDIVGREKEISFLEEVFESDSSEFVAIYGRRRIGKTFLVNQFFREKSLYFELTGRHGTSKSAQLKNFSMVFSDTFRPGETFSNLQDWDDAFNLLRKELETIPIDEKVVIFLDELPWLASAKSGFLEALDLFWNRYISRMNNIKLIVCGSAAAWMIRRVINNKAGLHNRLTRPPIHLQAFSLKESNMFLESKGIILDKKQVVDLYMVLGGVAQYLNLIPKGKSATEIIEALFFSRGAPLASEFHRLFSSLFDESKRHIEIIKALSSKGKGMTQSEIFQACPSLSPGGSSVSVLEELECCGFIYRLSQIGKKKKDSRYRLIDPLSLFHLKWVENANNFASGQWMRKQGSQPYRIWSGYSFENICLLHIQEIVDSMGITVVAENVSCWSFFSEKDSEKKGAQIDLIIDRADRTINLFELKYYSDEFVIDSDYAKNLRHKKSCFQMQTKTKKTVFLSIISPFGVRKNSHYHSSVDSAFDLGVLF